jgi:hypothetical protein
MKLHMTLEEQKRLGRYVIARSEYQEAKKAAGPKLVAVADTFDHDDVWATPMVEEPNGNPTSDSL